MQVRRAVERARGFDAAKKGTGFRPQLVDVQNGESEDDKFLRRGGFKGVGHFAQSIKDLGQTSTPGFVRGDSMLGKYNETLLKRAVSTPDGMYENSEPDGGALIPPDFTTRLQPGAAPGQDAKLHRQRQHDAHPGERRDLSCGWLTVGWCARVLGG